MKITKFEGAAPRTLHAALNAAIQNVAKEHGITIKCGTFRYEATSFKLSMEGKVVAVDAATGEAETITSVAKLMLESLAGYSVLDLDAALGKPGVWNMRANPKRYKVVDYNSRAHKTPWIVEVPGGKRFRVGERHMLSFFPRVETPTVIKPIIEKGDDRYEAIF